MTGQSCPDFSTQARAIVLICFRLLASDSHVPLLLHNQGSSNWEECGINTVTMILVTSRQMVMSMSWRVCMYMHKFRGSQRYIHACKKQMACVCLCGCVVIEEKSTKTLIKRRPVWLIWPTKLSGVTKITRNCEQRQSAVRIFLPGVSELLADWPWSPTLSVPFILL